ncbi:HIT domain-containing protein [Alloacidobacterium sp.]|uniref:HIT family protein n=1 Tax=Alloacidobacterium sp. TaxID=2951999 RepID=UPI002D3FD44B|nr:HIT domain-containing protein [Alloacidobacterium sp.]HYK35851.1 HIT domain-containing protein [Alloacidobacterium sp.]
MDHLWTPWRYTYVTTADNAKRQGVPDELSTWPGDMGCVFCNLIAAVEYAEAHGMTREQAEKAALIVHRSKNTYVVLNRYPYTSGHVMVLPFAHESSLAALPPEIAHELMDMAQRLENVLGSTYHPDGINLGLNLGKSAGAGVQGHLHLHILPRWTGDTNFMTVVGETRVLPEDLETTWQRVRENFLKK